MKRMQAGKKATTSKKQTYEKNTDTLKLRGGQ
jgi:hypothetical protein